MTKNEVKNYLNTISRGALLAEIYFVLNVADNLEIVKADFQDELQPEIAKLLMNTMVSITNDEEKNFINLTTADSRHKAVYLYDLMEYGKKLDTIRQPIVTDIRSFDFDVATDKFENIFGFIIRIGSENNFFTVFKKQYPVALLKKDGFSLRKLIESNTRIVRVTEDILKFNAKVDFFIVNNNLYINDIQVLERFFDFHNVIKNEAKKSIRKLDNLKLLDDVKLFKSDAENISFARKLISATANTKVIGKVNNKQIIEYTKTNAVFKDKFEYTEDGNKIVLKTKKSRRLFIKLLNDDIVKSELTNLNYDAIAKNAIDAN